MPHINPAQLDIFLLEEVLWIASCPIGVPSYDFSFEHLFAVRHPLYRPAPLTAVGRFGATENYAELYQQLAESGVALIHTPEQYGLASELTHWYPLLADLTPRSVWFEQPPSAAEVEQHFSWPIFLKGSRQTSRHRAALSILRSPQDYTRAMEEYRRNPILHWQAVVCRELVPLRPVPAPESDTIPPAFEFRTFWWRGQCVGAGPYWAAVAAYTWTKAEQREALAVAQEAARRLDLPFLVVDVAQTREGRWIVIEVNDGQESGYAGIAPVALWQRIIDIERGK
ncbi:DUF4343 domain-containing protein [Chloroflexia bacterium SDU3-3]|nr:DUF4343 domain-containing protein [Chloroflexia bacterium SDU3-3]